MQSKRTSLKDEKNYDSLVLQHVTDLVLHYIIITSICIVYYGSVLKCEETIIFYGNFCGTSVPLQNQELL